MKFVFLIALACVAIQATNSLPTTALVKDTQRTIDEKNTSRIPLLQTVKQYTQIFVSETQLILSHVLQTVPNTQSYEDSRRTLSEYLKSNKLYSTKFANCVWNIVDINRDMRVLLDSFGSSNATPERKEIMKLLEENGFVDLKHHVELILVRFVRGELGSTDDVNEDFC